MKPLDVLLRDRRIAQVDRDFLLVSEERRINSEHVRQWLHEKIGNAKIVAVRPKRVKRSDALDTLLRETYGKFEIKELKDLRSITQQPADIYIVRSIDFKENIYWKVKDYLKASNKPLVFITEPGQNNSLLDSTPRSYALYDRRLTPFTKVLAHALDVAPLYVVSKDERHARRFGLLLNSMGTYFSVKPMDIAAFEKELAQQNGSNTSFRHSLSKGVVVCLDAIGEADVIDAVTIAALNESEEKKGVPSPILYVKPARFICGKGDHEKEKAAAVLDAGALDVIAGFDPTFDRYLVEKTPTSTEVDDLLIPLERVVNAAHAAFLVREAYNADWRRARTEARKLMPYVFFHATDSKGEGLMINRTIRGAGTNVLHTNVGGKKDQQMYEENAIRTALQLAESWQPNIIYVDSEKSTEPSASSASLTKKGAAFSELYRAFPDAAVILSYNSEIMGRRGALEQILREKGMSDRTTLWPIQPEIDRAILKIWGELEEGFTRRINLEGSLIKKTKNLLNVNPREMEALLTPRLEWPSGVAPQPQYQGEGAAPGAASGRLYTNLKQAIGAKAQGKSVLFYIADLSTIDLDTFKETRRFDGLVTEGVTRENHYTIALQRLGKPIVKVRSGDFKVESSSGKKEYTLGSHLFTHRETIFIDGRNGTIYGGGCTVMPPLFTQEMLNAKELPDYAHRCKEIIEHSDEIMQAMGKRVLVNADTVEEIEEARKWGVDSIGLVRSENILKASDEMRVVFGELVARIMYGGKDDQTRAVQEKFEDLYASAFQKILVYQAGRFTQIRLLDPPFNQILVSDDIERISKETGFEGDDIKSAFEAKAYVRGAKLLDDFPQVYEAQVRALLRACAKAGRQDSKEPDLHIVVPYVTKIDQPAYVKKLADEINSSEHKGKLPYKIGAMLEVPTGCLITGDMMKLGIVEFAIGTNDLTTLLTTDSRDQTGVSYTTAPDGTLLLNRGVIKFIDMMLDHARKGALEAGIGWDYSVGFCGELHDVNLHPQNLGRFIERREIKYFSAGGPQQIPLLKLNLAQAFLRIHKDRSAYIKS